MTNQERQRLAPRLRCWSSWQVFLLALLLAPIGAHAAPDNCSELREQYSVALLQARVCEKATHAACSALRIATLGDPCGCQTSVNAARTHELDRLSKGYGTAGCKAQPGLCTRQCITPAHRCGGADASPLCGAR